jgi:hypothetical protein
MAERPVGVTDVASGTGVAQFRTRERTVSSQAVCEQYLIPEQDWVPSYSGMVATFRSPGVAVANQSHACLFNKTGSGVLVAVRDVTCQFDRTINSATHREWTASRITTAPTDGTLLTPVAFDTALSHSSSVEARGLASADGTAGTFTATPTGAGWKFMKGMGNPNATQAEQFLFPTRLLLPGISRTTPLILREGQGLLIAQLITGSASDQQFFRFGFDEYVP